MAQESCLTDSLRGIICSGKMTFCIFSRTRLTARNLFGAEDEVHHWLRFSLQSDTTEEENQVSMDMYLQTLYLSHFFSELPWLLAGFEIR